MKKRVVVPLISEFFGIKIYMYWDDHYPEHFHAEYGKFKALISIKDAAAIKGALPVRQMKLALAWCELHRDELMKNWKSAEGHGEIFKITGLN